MTKRTLILHALGLCGLLTTACGGTEATDPNETDTEGTTTGSTSVSPGSSGSSGPGTTATTVPTSTSGTETGETTTEGPTDTDPATGDSSTTGATETESTDDSTTSDGDTGSTGAAPFCGDGQVDEGEECEASQDDDCDAETCLFVRNRIFVTSTPIPGGTAFGGLDAADAHCQSLADTAGLDGTYTAWLSDSETDAIDRLGDARGWVRMDGLPFADTQADLSESRVGYPVLLDETGAVPPATPGAAPLVLTATLADGTFAGANSTSSSSCGDFRSDNPVTTGFVEFGRTIHSGPFWTEGLASLCSLSTDRALLCMGTDRIREVAFPSTQERRLAFVSSNVGAAATSGIDAHDAVCQSNADDAGLEGTYLALLAGDGSSALDRFDLTGDPWALPNGVLLAPTAAELGTATHLSPITYTADAPITGGNSSVRIGAATLAESGTAYCGTKLGAWTSDEESSAGTSTVGQVLTAWTSEFANTGSCSNGSSRVFCLQE